MKISTLLITAFLTWSAYDENLFRRRREGAFASGSAGLSQFHDGEELEENELVQHERREVIPPWLRGRPKKVRVRNRNFSTKPRDPRFSNQRKIRRMFNNL